LISIVTVGVVPEAQLMQAKDYALAFAAKPALGDIGFTIVSVAALLSTFSAINATIYGNARLGYFLAKEGELPQLLGTEKRNIPSFDILVITLFSLLLANTIELTEIAIIGSAGFLLIFAIVNVAAYKQADAIGGSKPLLLLATLASIAALITLLVYTYAHNPKAILVFSVFILISIAFEWTYGRLVRKHFLQRNYH